MAPTVPVLFLDSTSHKTNHRVLPEETNMKRLLMLFSTIGIVFLSLGGYAMLGGLFLPGAALVISGAVLIGAVLISFAILEDKGILKLG